MLLELLDVEGAGLLKLGELLLCLLYDEGELLLGRLYVEVLFCGVVERIMVVPWLCDVPELLLLWDVLGLVYTGRSCGEVTEGCAILVLASVLVLVLDLVVLVPDALLFAGVAALRVAAGFTLSVLTEDPLLLAVP